MKKCQGCKEKKFHGLNPSKAQKAQTAQIFVWEFIEGFNIV
jgi:hypothetical protein